jgi:hypothetical protein
MDDRDPNGHEHRWYIDITPLLLHLATDDKHGRATNLTTQLAANGLLRQILWA